MHFFSPHKQLFHKPFTKAHEKTINDEKTPVNNIPSEALNGVTLHQKKTAQIIRGSFKFNYWEKKKIIYQSELLNV